MNESERLQLEETIKAAETFIIVSEAAREKARANYNAARLTAFEAKENFLANRTAQIAVFAAAEAEYAKARAAYQKVFATLDASLQVASNGRQF